MRGDITIGSGRTDTAFVYRACRNHPTGTVVHPKAAIFALGGPIIIGMNCILEEGTIIVNRCAINVTNGFSRT